MCLGSRPLLATHLLLVAASIWLAAAAACGPCVDNGSDDDGDGGTGMCAEGATRCSGNTFEHCNGGRFLPTEMCPQACDGSRGCVVCLPGTGVCEGDISHTCRPDGSGYDDYTCDPAQGVMCDFKSGLCEGDCSPANLGTSYIGCEYYPTVTANEVDNNFTFAIAVSNTSSAVADVLIEDGALPMPMMFQVAPGDVHVAVLPWVPALKACTNPGGAIECGYPQETGALAQKGAYHLRSNEPVTVYQFNPLDYTFPMTGQFSYTNDASLLIPTNAWTGNYVVAAYPMWPVPFDGTPFPGLLAVTASQDNTAVAINTRAPTPGGGGSPPFTSGAPQTVMLNRGDVLELLNLSGDLTGSIVQADKPVQVIGGHYCTQVPNGITACDHMEESMFPVETLSTKYIVAAPAVPALPDGKVEIIRIVATQQDTVLTYDPPQSAPTTLASTGEFIEIPNNAATFLITANHKVLVAQYMEGQDAGGNTGDPAMALAVATDQYRMEYLFHAPVNYETNYVNITAPIGATVMLDGAAITTPLTAIGGSGFGLARVVLGTGAGGDGNHIATSDMPFGISVYGYGQYTSYWYPGGLDLAEIPVE